MSETHDNQIRAYRSEEENQLIKLWEVCGLIRAANDPYRDIAIKLAEYPDRLLVAEHQSTIVGSVMVGYEGHRGWINYLAVHPDVRRQGLGRALMQCAEQLLLELGCPKINLQIRRGNTDVIAFYEKIGFSEDAVVSMGKRLTRLRRYD